MAESKWLETLKKDADRRFSGMEWPSTQDEEWRRTDVSGIDFSIFGEGSEDQASVVRIDGHPASGDKPLDGLVRFTNGKQVRVEQPESAAFELILLDSSGPDPIASHRSGLEKAFHEADNRFEVWHYSRLDHGVFIHVPAGEEIPNPILVEFHGWDDSGYLSPYVFIHLEEGAKATAVIKVTDSASHLANGSLHVQVDNGAALSVVRYQHLGPQALSFQHDRGSVNRDGSLQYHQVEMGGRLVKTRFRCRLEGQGAEADLNGIYLGSSEQHLDIRTVQHHLAAHTVSRALYRGVVKGGARSIFQGLIDVEPNSPGTDAYLTNNNLVLNDGARADSIPSLKIRTDDVKCSHGSTIGRIDRNQLFYLMSRGFARKQAEKLLVLGFYERQVAALPPVLAEIVRGDIEKSLQEISDARLDQGS